MGISLTKSSSYTTTFVLKCTQEYQYINGNDDHISIIPLCRHLSERFLC